MGKDIGLDQLTSVVNNAKYLKEKKQFQGSDLMSQKQRFMLQICQFLTSIMSQSLKILRADPFCFGKSWRIPHAPRLMHTPQPHAQFVSLTVPPLSHVVCRSIIKLHCPEVATAHVYF